MTRITITTLTALILSGAAAYGEVPGNQPNGDGLPSFGEDKFLYVGLGSLGGRNSAALGMSDRGTVVGWSDVGGASSFSIDTGPPGQHAFLYRDGLMIDLGTLGGSWSEARAVNSRNQVVGASENAAGEQRAFYSYDFSMIDLTDLLRNAVEVGEVPGAFDRSGGVYGQSPDQAAPRPILFAANAINNEGSIVACGTRPGDETIRAFLLIPVDALELASPRYDYVEIGHGAADPPSGFSIGGGGTQPAQRPDPIGDALNDWGSESLLVSVTALMDLLIDSGSGIEPQRAAAPDNRLHEGSGEPPAAHDCVGLGLNDSDLVVGAMDEVAFVWDAFDLDQLETTEIQSQANAINIDGVAVGWASVGEAQSSAALWADGQRFLLHPIKGTISEANAINDAEVAVGWAQDVRRGTAPVAMLWSPVRTVDLNTMTLFPASVQDQVTLEDATAIDETGRIAGVSRGVDGSVRAFVLLPLD